MVIHKAESRQDSARFRGEPPFSSQSQQYDLSLGSLERLDPIAFATIHLKSSAHDLRELKLSIGDVAEKLGTSDEHNQKACEGTGGSIEVKAKSLAVVLKLDANEFERAATADRIRRKFGTIPLELAGKTLSWNLWKGSGITCHLSTSST